MALESANHISQLVWANPTGLDNANTSDDHHRNTKRAVYQSFPNIGGEVSASHGELNYLRSATSNLQLQLNALKDGRLLISATAVYSLYANSASYAGLAGSASFAYCANYALSANNATSAFNANSAVYAFSATNATTAVNATNSTNATSATYAFSATNATSAANATLLNSQAATYYTNASNLASGTVPNARLGASSLAASGYYTLPGGLTIQWGETASLVTTTSEAITFPVAFTTLYQLVISPETGAGTPAGAVSSVSHTTTGATLFNQMGANAIIHWVAVGIV